MRRIHPVEVEGGIFHTTARGNARAEVFPSELDYIEFLRLLAKVVAEHRWLCHAFCLMPNHYHLLLETPEANLARGMQRLNGAYARGFNARHRRDGHVFGGPYRAVPVERESHLLEVSRYIVLNPVRAGLCGNPADWPWSSFGSPQPFGFEDAADFASFVMSAVRPQPG